MALHILPPRQTFGGSFGAGLGQGISTGMQGLMKQQAQRDQMLMKQRIQQGEEGRISSTLEQLGIGPQEASVIAQLRPQERAKFLQSFMEAGGGAQSPQQELGGMQAQQQLGSPQEEAQPQTELQQLKPGALKQEAKEEATDLEMPEYMRPQKTPQIPQEELQKAEEGVVPQEVAPKKPKSVAEALQMKKKVAEGKEAAKQTALEKKEQIKEQQFATKATQKYYDKVKESAHGNEENLKRLDRMSKIIEKGSIPPSVFYNTMNALEHGGEALAKGGSFLGSVAGAIVGVVAKPIGFLARAAETKVWPDLEEFEKLTNDFVKGAKQFYGSRLTNFDLEQFMKTVPSLTQTDNGKKAVIRNLKNMALVSVAENNIMKEIIKENKGRPINLAELVEERLTPFKDEMAEDFTEGFLNDGINKKDYKPLELNHEKKKKKS